MKAKHLTFLSQSISARDENLSKTMFLPLAERMVEKMVKEDKIEAEAEVSMPFSAPGARLLAGAPHQDWAASAQA